MIIKNLENKIKLAGILSIGCFATSIVISGMVLAFCFSLVKAERKKIYVLDNDVPVLVWGIERSGFFNGREKWAKGFENQRV